MRTARAAKSVFRIQFASHLNVHQYSTKELPMILEPSAPSLALLGDIGPPEAPQTKKFLEWCDTNYAKIFWVPGTLELSDTQEKKHMWIERMDACQELASKFEGVQLCAKSEVHTNDPELTLLLTTLWHYTPAPMYTYSHAGPRRMVPEDYSYLTNYEMNWLLERTTKSAHKVAWLTYTSPYITTRANLFTDSSMLRYPKLITSLQGISSIMKHETHFGGAEPWSAVNMGGHRGFLRDAFWEYSSKTNAERMEEHIMNILTSQ